jgi:hypothetical protein
VFVCLCDIRDERNNIEKRASESEMGPGAVNSRRITVGPATSGGVGPKAKASHIATANNTLPCVSELCWPRPSESETRPLYLFDPVPSIKFRARTENFSKVKKKKIKSEK